MSQPKFKTLTQYGRAIRHFVLDYKSKKVQRYKNKLWSAACAQRGGRSANDNIPHCR